MTSINSAAFNPGWQRNGGITYNDLVLPDMVHAVMLRSPHAHARIKRVDSSRAKKAPGQYLLARKLYAGRGYGDIAASRQVQNRPSGTTGVVRQVGH